MLAFNSILDTVRPNKFLFCIQLRLGVFILATMLMVFGAIVASTAWIQVIQTTKHPLQPLDSIALYLHSTLWTLIALSSALGLFAAFRISHRLLTAYWIILCILAISAVAEGGLVFHVIFTPNTRGAVNKCLAGSHDAFTLESCRNGLAMIAAVAVTIYVVVWLFLTFTAFIVWGYAWQVKRGLDIDENAPVKPEQISHPAPLTMYNSFGAPGHNNGYAFSSVDNSFGKPQENPFGKQNGSASLGPNSSILGAGVGQGGGHKRNFSGERLHIV